MRTSQQTRCKSRKVAERDVETNVSGDTNDRVGGGGLAGRGYLLGSRLFTA